MTNTLIVIAACIALEQLFKGYQWPKEPRWVLRGLFWFALIIGLGEPVHRWCRELLEPLSPVDLGFMGLWGIVPALLVYQVMIYWIHRALHDIPVLWRIHQHHHSSERIDIWSAYRAHPLEVPIFALPGAIAMGGLLGVTEAAAVATGIILLGIGLFEHTNVKTPRWLGYFIARPENHMLHHARHVHRSNYADLPIIDMLFGTFECPEKPPKDVGFWNGASREALTLLMGKDATKEKGKALTNTP